MVIIMTTKLVVANVEYTTLADGRCQQATITDGERRLTVISPREEGESWIDRFDRFTPDAKGGCSVYRPMLLKDGTTKTYLIKGSMSLMVDMGWIDRSQLGSFSELEFDNYARTGVVAPGIKIRFNKDTDMSIFQNAHVVKVIDPAESWSTIVLSNGQSFDGQPHCSLLELAEMGLVDVDIAKLRSLLAAKEAIAKAEEDYLLLVKSLGGEPKEQGNYEDYRSWYEVPDVPGEW